ncbi:MAG TPA: insulinase family protein [Longimicrobiales bacterium]|nr:insulinase family protein [Longimicrobiales bacterium]
MRRGRHAALLALLGLVVIPSAVRAQGETAALPRDPDVVYGTLANGIRYYVRENHKPERRAELRLVVNAGSVLEADDQRGLAHFVEHMAFNGTRNFRRNELVGYLESVGMRFGADVNAYTSFDETVYMLQLPTDSAHVLEKGVQILEDWAWGQTFDPEQVKRERGVVLEEWRLGRGASERIQDKQLPVVFRGSKYAERLPIGTQASIGSADSAALRRFYSRWYRPDLMAVVAVGDFDKAAMERLIRERFSRIPKPASPAARPATEIPAKAGTHYAIATDAEATGTSVALEYLRAPGEKGTVRALRANLLGELVDGMLTERLSELAQKADPPFIGAGAGVGHLARTKDVFSLGAAVREGGAERGLQALLEEAERVRRHGFTATELTREKTDLLRSAERSYAERDKTNSSAFANQYAQAFLREETPLGAADAYALYQKLLPGITLEEVNALARQLVGGEDRAVLVSAPAKPGVAAPTETALAAVFDRVAAETIAPYADNVAAAPLVAHPPLPGRIASEREIAGVGVREWKLSNGARVLLKSTDFKADQILLRAYSRGGTSLVADSDYVAALTATLVVGSGGLGGFDLPQLRKALAGKAASAQPGISTLEEGLSGSASPKDLETMLQLVYLNFTQPRLDTAAFQSIRSRLEAALQERGASPEIAFQDTLAVTLAQHHPRSLPITTERLAAMSAEKSYRIFRERFSNAADFTFVFVGSFQPDSLRPLVERYLASLPSTGATERWKDLGIRPPTGVVKKVVRRGVEPKSLTQITFTGPFEFTRQNRFAYSSLGEVLRIRLREVLREDLGGTYGVNVTAGSAREPVPAYSFVVGFGSAPDRVDELTAALFKEIAKLQQDGPTADEIRKVQETQRRALETSLKENGYWLGRIVDADRTGEDMRTAIYGDDILGTLTPAMVKDAARRYLRADDYVQVTLMPETQAATP